MSTYNNIHLATVQPKSFRGEEEYKNAENAVAYLDEAAASGSQIILFPEGYPGPYSGPLDSGGHLSSHPIEMLQERCRKKKVYAYAGELEANPEMENTYFLTQKLISPEGDIIVNYKRVQPDEPIFNAYFTGRTHILPGNEIMVANTELGKIGLQICSEIFVPEIARIQMLMGAILILAPGGGSHSQTRSKIRETWHCILRARAAENLVYVSNTQNIYIPGMDGKASIVGPEGIIAQRSDPGIVHASLDLERLHFLRTHYYDDEILSPPPEGYEFLRTRPGQNHNRRPDLYGKLTELQKNAFDYHYYRRGLEAYKEEYERVKTLGIFEEDRPSVIIKNFK